MSHSFLFLGTSDISLFFLQKLNPHLSSLNLNLKGIVTSETKVKGRKKSLYSPLKQWAEDQHIPLQIIPHLKDTQLESASFYLTVSFKHWIPERLLNQPPLGVLNVHPSLLPAYRGAAPVPRQIWEGEERVGVSLVQSVKEWDAGPLLAQKALFLKDTPNASSLLKTLMSIGVDLFLETYPQWIQGNLTPQPQIGKISWAPKITPQERELHPERQTAQSLWNQIRACTDQGYAFLKLSTSKNLKILNASPLSSDLTSSLSSSPIGLICQSKGCFLKGSDGNLLLCEEVIPSGGKKMSGKDFANGFRSQFKLSLQT